MFGEPNLPHPEYTRGYADGVNDGWKDATAAQREPLPCGHPAACVEGGSSDPDAQVTMWCSACVAEDKVRDEERKRWIRVVERRWPHLTGIMADMIASGDADDDV